MSNYLNFNYFTRKAEQMFLNNSYYNCRAIQLRFRTKL